MTDFFAYETLTWPDAAALPRSTPLILPLGDDYDWPRVAQALDNPPQVGRLPALPFGWRGSGLTVDESKLGALVANLLESLCEDGFARVYALTPPELKLGLGAASLVQRTDAFDRPTLFLPDDAARDKVVLIPIGHTEQHGRHLPLSTDTEIINAIAQATAVRIPDQAVTLPAFPYGVSTHRSAFAGTLNCGGRAFEDFWLAVIDGLAVRGFDRFYFMSGHGGNCSFLVTVVKYAGERHRRIFCATTWLHTSGHLGAPAIARHRVSARGGMGHAGELETAMLLHLRPDLCRMDRVIDETDFITTPNYYMDWIEGGALVANPPWEDDSITGAYGAGSTATAEHGRLWLEAAVAEKCDHVAEIHEQQRRREERRQNGWGGWGA
ncbi:MAG: creatininase family protein [Caldilineaceae bacterium]|nr:creatininase family protein [Caldilineaceae bacterium]